MANSVHFPRFRSIDKTFYGDMKLNFLKTLIIETETLFYTFILPR